MSTTTPARVASARVRQASAIASRTRARGAGPVPGSSRPSVRSTRGNATGRFSACCAAIRSSIVRGGVRAASSARDVVTTGPQTGHCSGGLPHPHGRPSRTPRSHSQRSSPALVTPSTSLSRLASTVVPLRPAPTTDSALGIAVASPIAPSSCRPESPRGDPWPRRSPTSTMDRGTRGSRLGWDGRFVLRGDPSEEAHPDPARLGAGHRGARRHGLGGRHRHRRWRAGRAGTAPVARDTGPGVQRGLVVEHAAARRRTAQPGRRRDPRLPALGTRERARLPDARRSGRQLLGTAGLRRPAGRSRRTTSRASPSRLEELRTAAHPGAAPRRRRTATAA